MKHATLFLILGALALPACVVAEPVDAEYPTVDDGAPAMVVDSPPPAPLVEVVPPAVVGQVWVPGYWWWGPRGYAWTRGRYTVRRPGAVWVGPRYYYRGGAHYYYGGRWMRR
jgi:hypothetical protein